jgi:hypothetical protein
MLLLVWPLFQTFNPASNADTYNTAVGYASLKLATTGTNNTAIGGLALTANTTGARNVAVGANALDANTTSSDSTAIGYNALSAKTGGFGDLAIGTRPLQSLTTGHSNVAIGTSYAGYAGGSVTTGTFNTMVGNDAGRSATTGTVNTFIGNGSGGLITTWKQRTLFLVRYNGNQGGLDIRTASNRIVLSDGDGNPRLYMNENGILFSPPTQDNTTAAGANVFISAGQFYRSTSSQRYKNTITDATHGLTELLALRPVTYKGNNDGDTIFGGLIAEEVHDAGLTEFVSYDDQDRPDSLAYGNMVSLCIKAIQEQQATITALEARIATLESN